MPRYEAVRAPYRIFMNKTFSRLARKVVPSTSLLSHNPAFKLLVNLADVPSRMIWSEYRNLPPNHLRIRIGVGNRFLNNHVFYLRQASSFWVHCFGSGFVDTESTIVDIGCGCGRYAHHLRDYRYVGYRFTGRYIGIDIDQEMLDWCSANFDAERFQFFHSTHANKSYKQEGTQTKYKLPVLDESVDMVFSTSLLTHLLEPELMNYLEESQRALKPGKRMLMSCFCLDYPPPTYGGRHTFSHKIGNAYVESVEVPEAAVAYTAEFLIRACKQAGFESAEVVSGDGQNWQPILVAQKPVGSTGRDNELAYASATRIRESR